MPRANNKPAASPAAPAPPKSAPATAHRLKKVMLAAKLGDARQVLLTGDFNGWNGNPLPLKPAADGTWSVTLSLPPGEYQYRLLVDGQWRDHPEAKRRVPNPFGTENCVLVVS